MKYLLCILLILDCYCVFPQTDYWSYQVYFSGCPINHIPKGITIPDKDKASRNIINAIIDGFTYDDLRMKYPDSLDVRLEKLIAGKIIERDHNQFTILFPVIIGEKRVELRKIIRNRLSESNLSLDTLVRPLDLFFSRNPEMVFHFLWSRVIDDCWWNLYNSIFKTEKGPPSIAFIVYPPHPFQCGTNSDYSPANDMYAFSWSYNLFDDSFSVPQTKSFFDLATGNSVSKADHDFFLKHGLLDSANNSLLYTYAADDKLDSLCNTLKTTYINIIKGLFNYSELSRSFNIPADDLFIVVSHEIVYELIEMLKSKYSVFIPITLNNNPSLNFKYLVSIRYNNSK